MLIQIIHEAGVALKRNLTRSLLTMLGIVWGIATVTLLIAYGSSFRSILVHGFDAFGKSSPWPGREQFKIPRKRRIRADLQRLSGLNH